MRGITTSTRYTNYAMIPNMPKSPKTTEVLEGLTAPAGQLADRPRIDWRRIAAEVRADPSQWHTIDGMPGGITTTIVKRARLAAFEPAGSFDAASRDGDLYLRYLGEPVEPWLPWAPMSEFADLPRHPTDQGE